MSTAILRPEEQTCAELLEALLKERGLLCTWGPGGNPPDLDFNVTVAGHAEKWAVEVTGLFQYFDHDGEEATRLSFEVPIRKIVDRVNAELMGQMKCAYVISALGPFVDGVIGNLYNGLREYILSGRTDLEELDRPEAVAAQQRIVKGDPAQVQWVIDAVVDQRPNKITIKKMGEGKGIRLISGHSGTEKLPKHDPHAEDKPLAFVANVDLMLDYATERILKEKLPKMANLQSYDRKMLLVWNYVFVADASDVAKAFQAHSLEEIDGIFFVESSHKGIIAVVAKAEIVPAV